MEEMNAADIPRKRGSGAHKKQGCASGFSDIFMRVVLGQIGICVILLVVSVFLKFYGGGIYDSLRIQCANLLTDGDISQSVMKGFSDAGKKLGEAKQVMLEFLDGLTGKDADTNSSSSQSSSDASATSSEGLASGASSLMQTGAGGALPTKSVEKKDRMEAPSYATFAPYTLSVHPTLPLDGRVTSAYGYREHPINKKYSFHSAVDLAAPEGTVIVAALPGTVVKRDSDDTNGNYLVLRHSDGLETLYAHCSELLAPAGSVVRQGETIARVGSTGVATGPHLHFEIKINGINVDPAPALWGESGEI